MKCGTSIGANVREAQQAQSKKGFLSKISIALKEADETLYWLDLLNATDFLTKEQYVSFIAKRHLSNVCWWLLLKPPGQI